MITEVTIRRGSFLEGHSHSEDTPWTVTLLVEWDPELQELGTVRIEYGGAFPAGPPRRMSPQEAHFELGGWTEGPPLPRGVREFLDGRVEEERRAQAFERQAG